MRDKAVWAYEHVTWYGCEAKGEENGERLLKNIAHSIGNSATVVCVLSQNFRLMSLRFFRKIILLISFKDDPIISEAP